MFEFLRRLNFNRWTLGFFSESELENVLSGNFQGVHLMDYKSKKYWFADPFILSMDSKTIVVLVEELTYAQNKGRIARLEIDRNNYKLLRFDIILELPSHLSFPMIQRVDDKIFVLPENSAAGRLNVYKYDDSTRQLLLLNCVSNEPLTDATICKIGGEVFIFATALPNQNGNKLLIFKLDNNFNVSKHQEVLFSSNIARNAGNPFSLGKDLIRPAQDCNGDYGKKVILQKIIFDTCTQSFDFKNIGEISPFDYRYHKGVHTLNKCGDMFVFDTRGYLYPTIGRIVRPLINSLHKLGI